MRVSSQEGTVGVAAVHQLCVFFLDESATRCSGRRLIPAQRDFRWWSK